MGTESYNGFVFIKCIALFKRKICFKALAIRWSHSLALLRPKWQGNILLRHFNPHRWTDPDDPRVTQALILRLGLDSLESVEDYLLPRFIDGNPISKYMTFAVLFVEPSMGHSGMGHLCRL